MSGKAKQSERFVEDARELGLDTDEAKEAFERATRKITPPKKKGDVSGKHTDKSLNKKD